LGSPTLINLEEIIGNIKNDSKNDIVRIITYPFIDLNIFYKRMEALLEKGIRAIILDGKVQIGRYYVMGKGTNSIVLKGLYKDNIIVIKLLRLDASRNSLSFEAEVLKKIYNSYLHHKLVPEIIDHTEWMIILEYLDGVSIFDFLNDDIFYLDKAEISRALYLTLYKAFLLDKIYIDHGELSRPKSHILYVEPDYDPVFIDFESARYKESPKNFSSIIQAIFVRHPSSEYLRDIYNLNLEKIRRYIYIYNKSRSEETVNYILTKIFNL